MVEDIERLDFDKYTEREEPKMKDWRLPREPDWADKRMKYTNGKYWLMNLFGIPRIDVPELITSAEDAFEREQVRCEKTVKKEPHFLLRFSVVSSLGGPLFMFLAFSRASTGRGQTVFHTTKQNTDDITISILFFYYNNILFCFQIIYSHPQFEFAEGYNKSDGGVLFKGKLPKYSEHV